MDFHETRRKAEVGKLMLQSISGRYQTLKQRISNLWSRRRNRWITITVLVSIWLAVTPEKLLIEFTQIGCERPGVALFIVKVQRPYVIRQYIEDTYENSSQRIEAIDLFPIPHMQRVRTMCDLKDLVNISNEEDALRFARFGTEPLHGGLIKDGNPGQISFEIANFDDYMHEPEYGGTSLSGGWIHLNTFEWLSGYYGVMSMNAFASSGYYSPQVVKHGSMFEITRWLIVCPDHNDKSTHGYFPGTETAPTETQLVKELISTEGEYRRAVVKRSKSGYAFTLDPLVTIDN